MAGLWTVCMCFFGCNGGKSSYRKLFGDYDFSTVQYKPYESSDDSDENNNDFDTEDEELCKDYTLHKRFEEFVYVKAFDHICIVDYIPKENRYHEAVDTVVFPEYIEGLPVTYISRKGFSWAPVHPTHHIEKLYIPKTVTSIQEGLFIWTSEDADYIDSIEIDPENPVYEIDKQRVDPEDPSSESWHYYGIYDKTQKKLVGLVPECSIHDKCSSDRYYYVKKGTRIIGRHSINPCTVSTLILPESVRKVEFNYFDDSCEGFKIEGGKNAEFFPEYRKIRSQDEENSEESKDPDFVDDYKARGYAVLPDPRFNPIPDSFVVNGVVISNKLGYENGYIYEKENGEIEYLLEAPEDGVLTVSENVKKINWHITTLYYDMKDKKKYKHVKLKKVILPDTLEKVSETYYNDVLSFEISPRSRNFMYEDGFIINKNSMSVCAIDGSTEAKEFLIVPDGVKSIDLDMPEKNVFIPDSIVSMSTRCENDSVFYGRPDSWGDKYGRGINYYNWHRFSKIGGEKRAVYSVKENIRMRKSSDLDSEIECVVNNGSILYQIEGKDEEIEIDGINGHWIKVAAYKDAFDKDGKLLEPGTSGWVFDGYLKKIYD